MTKKIKVKNVKGVMTAIKVLPYKDCMVYIRRIYQDYFEYIVIFEGQIYTQYVIMKPAKGKTKLTQQEVQATVNMLWAGAEATIDTLQGVELSEADKIAAQKVIDTQIVN